VKNWSPGNWLGWSDRVFGLVFRVMSNIGMWFALLLAFILTVDVISRFAFNRPFKGVFEITELMMIMVVFLAAAYTQYMKSHISVDLVYSRFPKKLQTVLDVFLYLMSLGIWAIVTWRAFVYMQYLWEMKTVTDVQLIPVAPFQLILAIGCVMLSIALLLDLIKSLRKVFSS
jgi:TRAP-type C4-dicarboxylate transport system permease small subunit